MDLEKIKPDLKKDYLIYTKSNICSNCGGLCCKTSAGIYSPDDFKYELNSLFLLHLLMTRLFSIESIGEGEQIDYFLRPRHLEENPVNPNLYGGTCINWKSDLGCLLNEQERPYQCRTLIPLADGVYCKHKPSDKGLKIDLVNKWNPYQKELIEACVNYNRYSNSILAFYEYDENLRYSDIYKNVDEIIDKIKKVINNK